MKTGNLAKLTIVVAASLLVVPPLLGVTGTMPKTHVFTVRENVNTLVEDLNQGGVTESLRSTYNEKGSPLSEEVSISVKEKSQSWKLSDEGTKYSHTIEIKNDALKVYTMNVWTMGIIAIYAVMLIVLSSFLVLKHPAKKV